MKTLIFSLLFVYFVSEKDISAEVRDDILESNRRDTVMIQTMTVKQFKDCLAEIETGGLRYPYQAVNQFGYMGKYQISVWYLERFGRVTKEVFLADPWKQEVTMNRLCAHYLNAIHRLKFDKYIGKTIGGVCVTLEGLMAGYHQHPQALKDWLESDGKIDKTDGNNFPVSSFIRKYE